MVEQSSQERKTRLIAELARSRVGLSRDMHSVREGLDIGAHIKHAILQQRTLWFTGAAVTGWLLTRLPFRKKKVEEPKAFFSRIMPQPKSAKADRNGLLLTALGIGATLLKPVVTSFLTHKLSEFATRESEPKSSRRPARY